MRVILSALTFIVSFVGLTIFRTITTEKFSEYVLRSVVPPEKMGRMSQDEIRSAADAVSSPVALYSTVLVWLVWIVSIWLARQAWKAFSKPSGNPARMEDAQPSIDAEASNEAGEKGSKRIQKEKISIALKSVTLNLWLSVVAAIWCGVLSVNRYFDDWVYEVSRWGIMSIYLYNLVQDHRKSRRIIFAIMAVLFNPIAPIKFDSRQWATVDFVSSMVFLLYIFDVILTGGKSIDVDKLKKILRYCLILIVAGTVSVVSWGGYFLWMTHQKELAKQRQEELDRIYSEKEIKLRDLLRNVSIEILCASENKNFHIAKAHFSGVNWFKQQYRSIEWFDDFIFSCDPQLKNPYKTKKENILNSAQALWAKETIFCQNYMQIYNNGEELPKVIAKEYDDLKQKMINERFPSNPTNNYEIYEEIKREHFAREFIKLKLYGAEASREVEKSLGYFVYKKIKSGKEPIFEEWEGYDKACEHTELFRAAYLDFVYTFTKEQVPTLPLF